MRIPLCLKHDLIIYILNSQEKKMEKHERKSYITNQEKKTNKGPVMIAGLHLTVTVSSSNINYN